MFSYLLGYWFYTTACICQCCVQHCLCLYDPMLGFPTVKIWEISVALPVPSLVPSAAFSINVKSWWSICCQAGDWAGWSSSPRCISLQPCEMSQLQDSLCPDRWPWAGSWMCLQACGDWDYSQATPQWWGRRALEEEIKCGVAKTPWTA